MQPVCSAWAARPSKRRVPSWRLLHAVVPLLCCQAALAAQHEIPLFMSASNPVQQGFVRVINRSAESGTVRIHAMDDSGRRARPVTLSLSAKATAHFNSGDLETGNPSKGLSGSTGSGQGDWRLQLETDLDIEALAYIRTTDGFLTSMHDRVPGERSESGTAHLVPIFNPGGNRNQVSKLRLINANSNPAEIAIAGVDDSGAAAPSGNVNLTLAAGEARTFTAQELEAGGAGRRGRFGDGAGKWWLLISTNRPIQVMNLLESPTGNLTNLSTYGADQGIPLFIAASNPTQQGFARITNYTEASGAVSIYAIDDFGRRFGPVSLNLNARQTVHFNSGDLENGNPSKGLSGGVGSGQGDWRLDLESDLDIEALAYIRTNDGFLTSVHDIARSAQNRHHVPIFNPGSNNNQRSSLRLVNPGGADAEVVIAGLDDQGRAPPNGDVRLLLPAGEARTITAQQLERGGAGFNGGFGDGNGKWQLSVSANRPIRVMSLLESPTGNLTNLSTSAAPLAGTNAAPVAEDISLRSDLSNPVLQVQLMGTDADGDALTYVLHSPPEGDGYYNAFVEPDSGRLFASLRDDGQDQVVIAYRVTDGMRFSEVARVRITMAPIGSGGLGLSAAAPETYGRFDLEFWDDSNLPPAIDLSDNFPPVGIQGSQNSCVGWAVGHALKSYQERLEEGWEFGRATVFSPAWIYNQINGGRDNGSHIYDALDLIVDKGAATLWTMPYDPIDYRSQPGNAATSEARQYRASGRSRVEGTRQIKAALFNRLPVVVGMRAYDSFNELSGINSVYNTFRGDVGGHAVTIVGYDDNRFGGAFKIINSYGSGWGDGGYFWLPYEHFQRVVSEAYVLQDMQNGQEPSPNTPNRPVAENLPNLQVTDWSAEYDSRPGGTVRWQWTVVNTGTGTAPRGADVSLILSQDEQLDYSDWWVQYEEIPFDLAPGGRALRDTTNPRTFTFPLTLPAGTYYMAVWADSLQEVRESNENDNVSPADRQVEIRLPDLPDLAINHWWASWSNTGDGVLEYEVVNNGAAPTTRIDWGVTLILSQSERPEAGRYRYLFFEDANRILYPEQRLYRDENNQAHFNLLQDQFGDPVPAGTYYISLWVDDLGVEQESNEINNLSVGNQFVSISRTGFSKSHAAQSKQDGSATAEVSSAFNGRRLPAGIAMRKVEIVDDPDGTRRTVFAGDAAASSTEPSRPPIKPLHHGQAEASSRYEKVIRAADQVVFPRGEIKHMP